YRDYSGTSSRVLLRHQAGQLRLLIHCGLQYVRGRPGHFDRLVAEGVEGEVEVLAGQGDREGAAAGDPFDRTAEGALDEHVERGRPVHAHRGRHRQRVRERGDAGDERGVEDQLEGGPRTGGATLTDLAEIAEDGAYRRDVLVRAAGQDQQVARRGGADTAADR